MRPKVHVCWWGATLGPWRGYFVVANWHAYEGPQLYVSPNGTPWHHAALRASCYALLNIRSQPMIAGTARAYELPEEQIAD